MATRLQFRRGNAADWVTANPILAQGEPAYELDTGKFKLGDGVSDWATLQYFGGGAATNSIGAGWKDLVGVFSTPKGKGTSEPEWVDIGNDLFAFKFEEGDELFINFHVPHDWKIGTLAYPHIHWFCDAQMVALDTIEWDIEYTVTKGYGQGDTFTKDTATICLSHVTTATEVAGEHKVTDANLTQGIDMVEIDAIVSCKVRLANRAISNTGNIYAMMLDLHYESDGLETNTRTPSFTKLTGA